MARPLTAGTKRRSSKIEVVDGTIVGNTVHNTPTPFMTTDQNAYGDFILRIGLLK